MEGTATSNAEERIDAAVTALYGRISDRAASLDVAVSPRRSPSLQFASAWARMSLPCRKPCLRTWWTSATARS